MGFQIKKNTHHCLYLNKDYDDDDTIYDTNDLLLKLTQTIISQHSCH